MIFQQTRVILNHMELVEIQEKINPILLRHGIKRASVFGSVARGDDRPDSDVDVLVELGERPMGMFAYMGLIEEMEETLGRKVDLVTKDSANKFLKPYIQTNLKTIYEG